MSWKLIEVTRISMETKNIIVHIHTYVHVHTHATHTRIRKHAYKLMCRKKRRTVVLYAYLKM